MLAAELGEGLVSALHDALAADVDPRSGRHLAVHHQALLIEFVEMVPGRPVRHQIGIGDQHARRVFMRLENTNRLARLHQKRLVRLQPLQRGDDAVERFPIARGAADAAIDDQLLGRSATSASRLFISMRSGASVSQDLALSVVPCAARILLELSRRVINFHPSCHGPHSRAMTIQVEFEASENFMQAPRRFVSTARRACARASL